LVDTSLSSATTTTNPHSGYMYSVVTTAGNVNFCAGTAPVSSYSGSRNFSSDEPGIIYVHPVDVANPPTTTAGGTPLN
jgi:hypothetical protein